MEKRDLEIGPTGGPVNMELGARFISAPFEAFLCQQSRPNTKPWSSFEAASPETNPVQANQVAHGPLVLEKRP